MQRPEWNEILRQYFEHQQYSLKEFQQMLQKAGITSFYPCPVIHCPQSYGICIKHESGYKLSYSGDTRPCVEFADAAKDSTLLIHEATFGDDLQRNAFDHFHSTVGEAMEMYIFGYIQSNEEQQLEIGIDTFQSEIQKCTRYSGSSQLFIEQT